MIPDGGFVNRMAGMRIRRRDGAISGMHWAGAFRRAMGMDSDLRMDSGFRRNDIVGGGRVR